MATSIPWTPASLEHFQEKWNPVFRPKMQQRKNARAISVSGQREIALAVEARRNAESLSSLINVFSLGGAGNVDWFRPFAA
jgi:hypothetical protein